MLENPCLVFWRRKIFISGSIKEIAVDAVLHIWVDQECARWIGHIIDLLHVLSIKFDYNRLQLCSRDIHGGHEAGHHSASGRQDEMKLSD